jgi:hypothetical protein
MPVSTLGAGEGPGEDMAVSGVDVVVDGLDSHGGGVGELIVGGEDDQPRSGERG